MGKKNHRNERFAGSPANGVCVERSSDDPRGSTHEKPNSDDKPRKQSLGSSNPLFLYSTLTAIASIIGSLYFSQERSGLQDVLNWGFGGVQPSMNSFPVLPIVQEVPPKPDTEMKKVQKFMKEYVCHAPGGFCHPSLATVGRSHLAQQRIGEWEKIMEVPRSMQIWDLDALRDPFIREELFEARHEHTGRPLDRGAFFAAYLAMRIQKNDTNDPLRLHLDILPTDEDLVEFHPALWTPQDVQDLEPSSHSFAIVTAYQDLPRSEYKAFAKVSSKFSSQVSETAYKAMRVQIFGRTFGLDPPEVRLALENSNNGDLDDEIDFYNERAGVNLNDSSCHVMVPVIDMYNHHPIPKVGWEYNKTTGAFHAHTGPGGLPQGHEITTTYGRLSDSYLFAKYGFVNGDGSGYTLASIAALHKLQTLRMEGSFYTSSMVDTAMTSKDAIRQAMLQYLRFDDGYEECIEADKHPEAFELKRLKLEHLVRIADNIDSWIFQLPPRHEASMPAKTTKEPITLKPPRFEKLPQEVAARNVVFTCRLMVLHHKDLNESATKKLSDALLNDMEIISLESDSEEFDYRTFMCLARLTRIQLSKYSTDVESEAARVSVLNRNAFQSRNWTLAHVRLGEMQSLDVFRRLALRGAKEKARLIKERLQATSDEVLPKIRTHACRMEDSRSLLSESKGA